MADNKADDVQYDDDGNPITPPAADEKKDKKEGTDPKDGADGDDAGSDDDADDAGEDTGDIEVPVRSSVASHIITRQKDTIDKLREGKASRIVSDAKKERDLARFGQFTGLVLQDPENNRRFAFKKLCKLSGLNREEIDMMFPPTIDEIQAEKENEVLNDKKLPKIGVRDDHKVHMDIHAKADQNPATLAHMRAHERQMITRRNRPDLFPPPTAPNVSVPGAPGAPTPPQPASVGASRGPEVNETTP